MNQRFPVFFDEKRPFFMEGLGLFNLAGSGGDASMRSAVHTRRIVDPIAGLKLTGTAGRETFAVLSAADESLPGNTDKLFTIGRALRNYGNGQYIGALVTDTEFGVEHNRVAAADIRTDRGPFRDVPAAPPFVMVANHSSHLDAMTKIDTLLAGANTEVDGRIAIGPSKEADVMQTVKEIYRRCRLNEPPGLA